MAQPPRLRPVTQLQPQRPRASPLPPDALDVQATLSILIDRLNAQAETIEELRAKVAKADTRILELIQALLGK